MMPAGATTCPRPTGMIAYPAALAPRAGVPLLSEGWGRMGGMTVTGRLELVALDAPDIEKLASFYAELAGWEIIRKDSDWITIRTGEGQEIAFQLAADHVAPQWPGQEHPQQFHLDLLVDGYQAAAERAIGLGATRLADGPTWVTLADPAGHPFDLCQKDGVGPVMGLFAVTIDAPDALALARFYAGEARARELGASRLNGGGERFRVFADPAGHPFCLTL